MKGGTEPGQAKKSLKVSCFYAEQGAKAPELIRRSFELFLQSELVKSCK